MSLLVSVSELEERARRVGEAPELASVARHMDALLSPLLSGPVYIPESKALYSRWGSLCRDDGAELGFDPYSPHAQRCTACGRIWTTEHTHRWWVYWYQQWLAERVWMLALRSVTGGDAACGVRAGEILSALAARYGSYSPHDNVLGPSRPFFSTYLESVWVLHVAAAASLLEERGALSPGLGRDLRERVFRESARMILDFDEGRSNRQVWNAAALYALGTVLGDEPMRRAASHGKSGILATIRSAIAADGLWYEGENYHWFALRGLAWAAEMLRAAGEVNLWEDGSEAGSRFRAAFRAPVLTVLPDFTFPARRDSRFGVSLRQRRMAELWELALARTGDAFFASLLRHVYDSSLPAGSGEAAEVTELERAPFPGGVSRERLGWKGLLWMLPVLPVTDAGRWEPGGEHLEHTGVAIFRRRETARYVSLDYGEPGGGHGHPDRLNLTLHEGGVPWLVDFGTGSYASPSLAWYRTTLAHNAPLVDGLSQAEAHGACVGYEDRGDYGWVCAQLVEGSAYEGAALQRTVVAAPFYVLDVVQMGSVSGERTLALPWHGLGRASTGDHGMSFVRDEGCLTVHVAGRQPFHIQVSTAPGPPVGAGESASDLAFPVVLASGEEVTVAACLDTSGLVSGLECGEGEFYVRLADGTLHTHGATESGWSIDLGSGNPVELGGTRILPELPSAPRPAEPPPSGRCYRRDGASVGMDGSLALFRNEPPLLLEREDQFRRAEDHWPGPEQFSARAWLEHDGDLVYVGVDVIHPEPFFRQADAADPELENENPDIHSDGIQVYVSSVGLYGWLVVPDTRDERRIRASVVRGSDAEEEMVKGGAWSLTPRGYRLTLALDIPEALGGFGFDLYVNRAVPDRQRRTGQLVFSGARNSRLYLAGDRPLPGPLPWIEVER